MGLFDSVMGSMLNSAGEGQAGAASGAGLMQEAIALLNSPAVGGLPGLMKSFEGAGLGHVIGSWIGSGTNLPIDANQLQQVLTPDVINKIAAKVGIPPEMVTQGLAQILPHVVDHATPDGQVPPSGQVQPNALVGKGLEMLTKKLFG